MVFIHNDTYSVLTVVRQFHQIPHLGSSLREQDNTFDVSTDSIWNGYTRSIVPMPVICLFIALLMLFVFQITCCAVCCKKDTPDRNQKSNVWNWRILFAIMLVIVVLWDQSILFGNKYLNNGISTTDDSLDYLKDTFTTLNTDGDNLISLGEQVQQDLQNASDQNNCNAVDPIIAQFQQYFDDMNSYLSYIENVPDQCSDAKSALNKYGRHYKDSSIWVIYAMFIVSVGIMAVGMCFATKGLAIFGIAVSNCVNFVTFLIVTIEMFILMLLADFCMAPTDNLLMIVPDSVYNVTAYYTTCTGTNPFIGDLQEAELAVANGKAGITAINAGPCPNDPYLVDALNRIDQMEVIFADINGLIACPPNQAQAQAVLGDGLCHDTFKGTYVIWLGQYVCAAALLIACIFALFATTYFNAPTKELSERDAAFNNDQSSGSNSPMNHSAHNNVIDDDDDIHYAGDSTHAHDYHNTHDDDLPVANAVRHK